MSLENRSTEIRAQVGSSVDAVTRTFTRQGLWIPQLRAALHGRVIVPDDSDYDKERTIFSGEFDRRPAVIVRAADATDVSHVVSLARETGMELAIRTAAGTAPPVTAPRMAGSCSIFLTCRHWISMSNIAPRGLKRA